jgi:hypothetical protein
MSVLPVFFAGLVFILTLKYVPNLLKYPMDFGISFKGKKLFGENKTFRGPFFMSFFTGLFGFVLVNLMESPFEINWPFLSYFAIGFLYSLGELPNSFIKRRLDILPGKTHKNHYFRSLFKIVDIYDSLIFCGLGYIFIFRFDPLLVVVSVLLGGAVHFTTDALMRTLKLK